MVAAPCESSPDVSGLRRSTVLRTQCTTPASLANRRRPTCQTLRGAAPAVRRRCAGPRCRSAARRRGGRPLIQQSPRLRARGGQPERLEQGGTRTTRPRRRAGEDRGGHGDIRDVLRQLVPLVHPVERSLGALAAPSRGRSSTTALAIRRFSAFGWTSRRRAPPRRGRDPRD